MIRRDWQPRQMSEFSGNWFALLALLGWPLVSMLFYKSMPFSQATIWTILGGYLTLPPDVAIKFAMIPAFDKSSIPNICACVGCIACSPSRAKLGFTKLFLLLAAVYLLSPLVTSALNNDLIAIGGGRVLPGVGYYDAISAILYQTLLFLPFLLAWRYLRDPADIEAILRALVVAGLFYSLPTLFEIRMSPQLSAWIYGVFASTFITEARYGGFRPVVFLINGLALSFFLMTTVLAAIALRRSNTPVKRIPLRGAAAYLALVVVLTKSAGSLLYTIVGGLLVSVAAPRTVIRIATMLAMIALAYPLLRTAGAVPTDTMVNMASAVNSERGSSLQTRFDQEDQLLARASERFMFGWGRYGRNRVYTEDYGGDVSLTDGMWIITMGQFGLVGFLTQFGLLSLPVFRAARSLRYVKSESEKVFLSSLGLIMALTVFEQIPNASISPWSWLLAGVLLARTEALRSPQRPIVRPKMKRLSSSSARTAATGMVDSIPQPRLQRPGQGYEE
jgi:hypothetical protein